MQIKLINMIKPLSFWCKLWHQAWGQGVPAASGMVFPGHCGMWRVLGVPAGSQQQFCVQLGTEGIREAHFVSQVLLIAIVEGQITQDPALKKRKGFSGTLPDKSAQKTLQGKGGQHFPTESFPILCCVYYYKVFEFFPLKSMAAVHPSVPNSFSPVCPHWIQPGHIQSLLFHPK